MNDLGWIGAALLACSALPEVIRSFRVKACALSWGLLLMWWLGEVLVIIPILTTIKTPFLIFNYGANIILVSALIYYKIIGARTALKETRKNAIYRRYTHINLLHFRKNITKPKSLHV